jgi:hypothetical protein
MPNELTKKICLSACNAQAGQPACGHAQAGKHWPNGESGYGG